MRLSRDKIQRMINAGGGSSSGGGGGSDIAGGATQAWVNQNYVSIEFFRKVFKVWAAGETSSDPDVEIMPNDITTTVKNIQAQAGLWTEAFLSALGQGSGGGTGGATTLDQLDDVVIQSPTNGQALIYNATTQMWVNGTIQSGTDMTTVWSALAAATNEQINASHLSGVLADYVTTTSLQTILGDYLTLTAADQRYITIAYFDRLFRAYNGDTLVSHNDTTSTIDNIKAMFGFWTDLYISALGRNSAATGLGIDNLTDVTINTPTAGQVLQYNATSSKWENATIQTVVALSGLTDVLLSTPSANQALIYDGTKWINSSLKTVNGYSILGSGDIPASGGGTGNYLPIAGGPMYGPIYFGNENIYNGANPSNYARLGAFNDHIGGVVLQSGASSSYTLTLIDKSWSYSIMDAYNNSHIRIGRDLDLNVKGRYFPFCISYPSSMWLSDWIVSIGDSTKALLIGLRYGYGSIGLYGTSMLALEADYIGVGNYNAQYKLDVTGSIRSSLASQFGNVRIGASELNNVDNNACIELLTGTAYIDWHFKGSSSDRTSRIIESSSGTLTFDSTSINVQGSIYATGAITALSDARKKDITGEAGVTVEQIAHAPAVQFLWKDKERRKDGQQVGTLAQYWQTVLPEVVLEAKDEKGTLSMQYGVAALVSAITIARKVVDHEQRIKQLEKENEELKKQLNAA